MGATASISAASATFVLLTRREVMNNAPLSELAVYALMLIALILLMTVFLVGALLFSLNGTEMFLVALAGAAGIGLLAHRRSPLPEERRAHLTRVAASAITFFLVLQAVKLWW